MRFVVKNGNITKENVDAIVNAANSTLLGGGGVDGAIHMAAGLELLEECRKIRTLSGKCSPGNAVITSGYNLTAKRIIHTVGPVWRGGIYGEKATLRKCYENSIRIATEESIRTIAFPNISTGVYGFPKEVAAKIVFDYFIGISVEKTTVEEVRFICLDSMNYDFYKKLF
ncbi:MAG TPA: O-acetyl-ADP-ribose deacetylase [bacterium]|nr:O-acetyl-ADP-ribose deacetylase [bacterium]